MGGGLANAHLPPYIAAGQSGAQHVSAEWVNERMIHTRAPGGHGDPCGQGARPRTCPELKQRWQSCDSTGPAPLQNQLKGATVFRGLGASQSAPVLHTALRKHKQRAKTARQPLWVCGAHETLPVLWLDGWWARWLQEPDVPPNTPLPEAEPSAQVPPGMHTHAASRDQPLPSLLGALASSPSSCPQTNLQRQEPSLQPVHADHKLQPAVLEQVPLGRGKRQLQEVPQEVGPWEVGAEPAIQHACGAVPRRH